MSDTTNATTTATTTPKLELPPDQAYNLFTLKAGTANKQIPGTRRKVDGKWKTDTQEVVVQFPQLNLKLVNDLPKLMDALDEVLRSHVNGVSNFASLAELINHGLEQGLKQLVRRGNNLQRSASQNKSVKMYIDLVKNGGMSLEDVLGPDGSVIMPGAITMAKAMGIPGAEEEIRAAVAHGATDTDSDSDDDADC